MSMIQSFIPCQLGSLERLLFTDPELKKDLIDSSASLPDSASIHHIATLGLADTRKFWVVEDAWQWLHRAGVSAPLSDIITFVTACAVLVLMVWLLDMFISRVAIRSIQKKVSQSKTAIDDLLFERKFFNRLFNLIPLTVIILSIQTFFHGFDQDLMLVARLLAQSAIIFNVMMVIFSILDTMNDAYQQRPESRQKSIKGYIQVSKIVTAFIAIILIISTLIQKDPTTLLVGLGAAAAILSLVFKDTILGFVASIQLSAQDMVRPGDWITMPNKGADGTVLDINLNSVKVQNWDNTTTMIPIYSMVSEAFTNWRGMDTSGGRRFVRTFYMDISTIVLATDDLLERLAKSAITEPHAAATVKLAHLSSPTALTNMALFRAYMEIFLFQHPKINHELLTYARYLPDMTDRGVGLEIYAFSVEKASYDFDAVHRSVVEHVIATAPLFDLRLFQAPSSAELAAAVGTLAHRA